MPDQMILISLLGFVHLLWGDWCFEMRVMNNNTKRFHAKENSPCLEKPKEKARRPKRDWSIELGPFTMLDLMVSLKLGFVALLVMWFVCVVAVVNCLEANLGFGLRRTTEEDLSFDLEMKAMLNRCCFDLLCVKFWLCLRNKIGRNRNAKEKEAKGIGLENSLALFLRSLQWQQTSRH